MLTNPPPWLPSSSRLLWSVTSMLSRLSEVAFVSLKLPENGPLSH
jgi:hypothetical protein